MPLNNSKVTIIFDQNGQIVENQSYANLNNNDKSFVRDLIGDVYGVTVDTLRQIGGEAASPATKPLAIISFEYNYLNNLKTERDLHGNIGYQDEIVAFFQATGNWAASNIGGVAVGTGSLFLSGGNPVIGGAGYIAGGFVSGKAYDLYAKEGIGDFVRNLYPDSSKSGYVFLSDTNLNYTPIPGTTLTHQQRQQKAIELLTGLSNGQSQPSNQSFIPQKIIVNSSEEANAVNSVYTVKSGDTLSQIAKDFGYTIQELIEIPGNEYLADRISADGKYALIKAGQDKVKVPPKDNDADYVAPLRYNTNEDGDIIFGEEGSAVKDLNAELDKAILQNNGQTISQKAEVWLKSIGSEIKDWVSDVGETVSGFMKDVVSTIGGSFTTVSNWFSSIFSNGESDKVYNSNQQLPPQPNHKHFRKFQQRYC